MKNQHFYDIIQWIYNGINLVKEKREELKLFQRTILTEKIKESLSSVLPVTAIVFLLLITVAPVSASILISFIIGTVLLIVGMGLFTLGAELSMMPMGQYVGSKMTKTKKLWLILLVSLFVGVMITISEPDLTVLAEQISTIGNMTLIWSVALGVGIMLVVAMLRIVFKIKLKYLLVFFYAIVFILAFFVPKSFLALSFDSGGVTTGPMTVPFIMALGVGVSAIRADKDADNDSFGLVALCSVGPIIAVMLLGIINNVDEIEPSVYPTLTFTDSDDLFWMFIKDIPKYAGEVLIAVGPIVVFFLIFRLLTGGRGKGGLGKIMVGVLYTFVGLTLFLTGVNVGFLPLGHELGKILGASSLKWIIVPIGMIIGYFIVAAEPAVQVLKKQVEEETEGAIPQRVLGLTLSIGVALSVGIALLRVITGIPIMYVIIPGYLIAIALSFIVPDVFTSIAFDSGGVASGPMTATFLLPFAVGACSAVGGNVATDAFGVVAMVAMTPLIAIQILGLVYKIKQSARAKAEGTVENEPIEVIELQEESHTDTLVSDDDDIIDF